MFNYFYPCLRNALKYIQGSWNCSSGAREKMNKRQAKKKIPGSQIFALNTAHLRQSGWG